ncbi:hypothetical protein ONS95_005822 [Cadophora gregata]|uniref:uncharacterized protein n=1 Tax=Cadophora gregata TaxID=51156 RepID=UPI0026DC509D|nr:uncharacterized protein ONS95_005822 [Cadophora gregata]KAK0103823.1 hypothetical protein ONS95_005822 [Cadophora gregata]
MVKTHTSVNEYVGLFDESHAYVQSREYRSRYYKESLDTVWSLTLNQLSPPSGGTLQVLSFLDPDYIQDSILNSSRTVALEDHPWNESDLLESQAELLQAALIARSSGGDGLQVHRLVQAVVRERMDPDEFRKALSSAVTLVSSAWIDADSSEQGRLPNPKIRDDLLPHVNHLKEFEANMTDSESGICTKTDFDKLLSYVEDHVSGKGNSGGIVDPLKAS